MLYPAIDRDELEAAVKDSLFGMGSAGFCKECGAQRDGCEPDARDYECYECGAMAVDGAEWLMISIL